jgi:hypothetical protein
LNINFLRRNIYTLFVVEESERRVESSLWKVAEGIERNFPLTPTTKQHFLPTF